MGRASEQNRSARELLAKATQCWRGQKLIGRGYDRRDQVATVETRQCCIFSVFRPEDCERYWVGKERRGDTKGRQETGQAVTGFVANLIVMNCCKADDFDDAQLRSLGQYLRGYEKASGDEGAQLVLFKRLTPPR